MPEKVERTFDVWIVETNTVYRSVPFAVITDWVQQGRLLAEDKLRAPTGQKWVRVSEITAFAAYLPKAEPHRADDRAEALEPVQMEFAWKRRSTGAEDDDVDMIPLIDVSLVLLVFFMMTATVSSAAATIAVPEAAFKLIGFNPEMWWIGIDRGADGEPRYSLGRGDRGQAEPFQSREALLAGLSDQLQKQGGPVDVRIRAHRNLPYKYVRDMTVELYRFRAKKQIARVLTEVSEKQNR
jgi:biopolymer transport protein ExbD